MERNLLGHLDEANFCLATNGLSIGSVLLFDDGCRLLCSFNQNKVKKNFQYTYMTSLTHLYHVLQSALIILWELD
jgi:hypothetical protein